MNRLQVVRVSRMLLIVLEVGQVRGAFIIDIVASKLLPAIRGNRNLPPWATMTS
jgi:xanthine/uracil/vitamin C permease (AzgA family)